MDNNTTLTIQERVADLVSKMTLEEKISQMVFDAPAIERALRHQDAQHNGAVRRFHELEQWRERLISEGSEALNERLEAFPGADRQHLRQLIRNALREHAAGKPVHVCVMHANTPSEAEALKGHLEARLECRQVDIYDIGPAVGVHVGPNAIGLSVYPV